MISRINPTHPNKTTNDNKTKENKVEKETPLFHKENVSCHLKEGPSRNLIGLKILVHRKKVTDDFLIIYP